MPPRDDYKEWQERYDDLNKEGWNNHDLEDDDPDKWDTAQERDHAENMRLAAYWEDREREEAREDWDEDGNDGHDDRIERARDNEQLAANKRDHLDGQYDYATPMQRRDDDLHRELEEENNRRWQEFQEEQNSDSGENEEAGNNESIDMDIDSDDDT